MNPRLFLLLSLLAMAPGHARAVAVIVNGSSSYNTSAPTVDDIPDWNTGWAESGDTGWDYVGVVNGASGVYLGNDWVITAAHVSAGTFVLDGTDYDVVPGSAQGIVTFSGTADLTLFQLTEAPPLPSLTLAATTGTGSLVAMIGYGGGNGETWGLDSVSAVNVPVQVTGYSYNSRDFETVYGAVSASGTNDAALVGGDSGGGDFIYDSAAGEWTLAGINEAIDGNNDSYMVQLSHYASKIDGITGVQAVPEPGGFLLDGMALTALLGFCRNRRRSSRRFRA